MVEWQPLLSGYFAINTVIAVLAQKWLGDLHWGGVLVVLLLGIPLGIIVFVLMIKSWLEYLP